MDLSLSISGDGATVYAKLAAGQVREAEARALERMAQEVRDETPENVLVINGQPSWESWRTV